MRNKTSYWNEEYNDVIVCPYCEEKYEPSYVETYIGHELVDCYTENRQEFVCDKCGKKFTMYGFQTGLKWEYHTETIDGQMTREEAKEYYKSR